MLLVKKHLTDFVKPVETDKTNTLVIRISKDLFGTDLDVMFISACIQPYDSGSGSKQTMVMD